MHEVQFRPLLDEIEDTHDMADTKQDGQQRLRSKVLKNSVWNCDGEVVDETSVDVRSELYQSIFMMASLSVLLCVHRIQKTHSVPNFFIGGHDPPA